ncbi:MAG: RNA polymerase factor sigma-54 [Sulfuricella sp.]|nr:RNA polymerase factor sigma-54 [Sulfuricella sp.]
MKHSLQLKLSQQLTLTPQLQQSIRLLQLSTLELNNEIETFIEQNPFLERPESGEGEAEGDDGGEGVVAAAPAPVSVPEQPVNQTETEREREREREPGEDGFPDMEWEQDGSGWAMRDEDEDSDFSTAKAETISLQNHLISQMGVTQLSERDKHMVEVLIESLNEDGYLMQSLEELAELLPPELEVDPIELHTALLHLQNLDPPGVGARDLAECLALQLAMLPLDTPALKTATELAKHHLGLLATRDFAKLKKLLSCDDDALRAAQQLITGLNPRPGADFSSDDTRYIQHDVEVRKVKGKWVATLNSEAMPKLRINRMYADIMRRNRENSGRYLASQLQEAKWMIKNVQQRFDTILRVSQAIVERQRNFFEHGEVAMRPLVLREIAEEVSLHESTISRVTTQKFMLTPKGIFELKYFFGSHVATDTGGACSATAIRALIKQLVSAENPQKPLSDSQITDILAQQGIVVARRTVAKYRESLQIPAVGLRKSL